MIPEELTKALSPIGTKRLIKVRKKSKKALETGWAEPQNQYTPDDSQLLQHLTNGGNYGIVGGRGLALLDTDHPETEAIAQTLPPTFMIQSGGKGQRYHRYYQSDMQKTIKLETQDKNRNHRGEIRCDRNYVVGPGSVHEETGNLYLVHDPRPLTWISEAKLREAFRDYITPEPESPPPREVRQASDFDTLNILQVCTHYSIKLSKEGSELRGRNPTHGDNPSSFAVNPEKNVWRCHPCQSGGGPAELIAVCEGIISCREAKKGCLQNENFVKVVKAAQKHGLIPNPEETFKQLTETIPPRPIEPLKEGQQKNPDDYFIQEKGKQPQLRITLIIKEILSKYHILTFTDTEQSYLYHPKTGLYIEDAITTVKSEIMRILLHRFKKSYSEEIIYQVKILTYTNRDTVEPPEELFPCKNGILNLKTRELYDHSPDFFFTARSDVNYVLKAKPEKFLSFLEELACKKKDTLQEFAGYMLLNSSKYKKALFLSGPTDSGKTTFTKALVNVLGSQNVCSIPIQKLDHRFQEQRLYQKRANIVGDLGSSAFNGVSMFKRTTGGDIIEAEVKGANKTIKFVWTGKHWFDANDLPDPEGDADTDAFYNRLILITFSKQVPKSEQNKNLPNELAEENEKSGILNWMLEGLDRLETQKDFTDRASIDEIRDFYKRASNNVYCFAEDQCLIVKDSVIQKGETFRLYAEYCIKQNFSAIGKSKFYENLQKALPAITSDKETFEDLGRVHVFKNLEIKEADLSKMSKMSINSTLPPLANAHSPGCNADPQPKEKITLDKVVLARSGNVETMDKLDKLDNEKEKLALLAKEFLLTKRRYRSEHEAIENYVLKRVEGVSVSVFREVLWKHPWFVRPDSFTLMLSSKGLEG